MTISANFPTTRPSLMLDFSNQITLDPRINFNRSSPALYYDDTSATLAEQNLFLQSNAFSNTYWNINNIATPVQGATDPLGGTSAWTLTVSGAGSVNHSINNSAGIIMPYQGSTTSYTLSAYFQAGAGVGSSPYATLIAYTGSANNYVTATFNLASTGSVTQALISGTPFTAFSTSISQVGSTAWYRCSLTVTVIAQNTFYCYFQPNNAGTFTPNNIGQQTWTALGTETLLMYGSQLEQHSAPTAYNGTTTVALNNYIPTLQSAAINVPRFDYDPVSRTALGLLVEKQTQNLLTYSQAFDNAAWNSSFTISKAANVAPDGTQTAQLMVLSSTSGIQRVYQNVTYGGNTCTFSVYAKYYGQQFIQLTYAGASNIYCNFDLVNGSYGTPTSCTPNIQPVGNGWYRCSITFATTAVTAATEVFAVPLITSGYSVSLAGNGFNGFYLWGSQVESIPYANNSSAPAITSYVYNPVATQNTRGADIALMTGTNLSQWYNNNQGTYYVEFNTGGNGSGVLGTQATNIIVGTPPYYSGYDGTNNLNYLNNFIPNATYKIAIAATNTSTTFCVNGGSTTTQNTTKANAFLTATTFYFGYVLLSTPNYLNGHLKKFAFYPIALTTTNIQNLTAN